MKIETILLAAVVVISVQIASAEPIPDWIKNNAKWWADGTIGDSDFVQGVQYMINNGIIQIPATTHGEKTSEVIPVWVKNNAKWWADGTISDADFISGIQFLIENGMMTIPAAETGQTDSATQQCAQKPNQREQYECEKAMKATNEIDEFKSKATMYVVGPVTFYYAGATVERSGGQDIVNLKILVENTGSQENVSLYCTGPAVCNYDVSDGTTTYKYAANDFTNGQIVLKPESSRMFNMLYGPAIGYGSYVDFKFDPSKEYVLNVKEPWGSGSIPLNLK